MAENQKAIFIRFNLDDDADKGLYQKLVREARSSVSLTAYAKRVLEEHFTLNVAIADRQEFHRELLSAVREEMQTQGMKLVGALLAGIGSGCILPQQEEANSGGEARLPDECEKLPDELKGMLDFIG